MRGPRRFAYHALPGGRRFTVIAEGLSEENKYVKSVKLNGKPLEGDSISHEEIMSGGELVFEMTALPHL